MIAAIYARKSTAEDDVANEAQSVPRQVEGARAFITAKGWALDEHHIYTDKGVSGALFANRPDYQRMMRGAAAGAFDALVFFDLDRLGRDGHKTMVALNTLTDLGVTLWDSSTGRQIQLDTFENRLPVILQAEFAQQYRDQVRKHTRDSHRQKATQGYVTGGKVFGYTNVRIAKGHTTRVPNEAEAAVVRDICERFANGQGLRTIALALNTAKAPSPRAQQGRPNGWSASSVREVLIRPLYRGELVWGRTVSAYGRELGKGRGKREAGQIARPEDTWIRRDVPDQRIITADLAARVDARRETWRQRTVASKGHCKARHAYGRFLLSGGLLLCPSCGGHFEAVSAPWKNATPVYVCATRRRKPGVCTNTLALPITKADSAVLDCVEGEALGTRFIEELLRLVDQGEADNSAQLTAERDRLQEEVQNLVGSIAAGVPADTVAPAINERQREIAKLETKLRQPRPVQPKIDELRAALEQRATEWRATLRAEPKVARLLLRRLIGPLTLADPADHAAFDEWEASLTPALLEGLAHVQVLASPPGIDVLYQIPLTGTLS